MAVQRRLQFATALQEAARGMGMGRDLVKDRQNNDETLEELLERLLQGQAGESALSTSFPTISSPLTKQGLFSGHAAAPYRGGVNEELIGRTLSRHPFGGDYRRRKF